jgi:uncharacterized protein
MMTPENSPADSPLMGASSPPPSILHNIFLGPNGIRAGWRLAIYIAFFVALAAGRVFTVFHIPQFHEWLTKLKGVMAAGPWAIDQGANFLLVLIPALIMSKIEKRPFDAYGLPVGQAFRKRFWLGLPYGFAMVTLQLAFIAAFHGFSITGIGASGAVALKYGILYSFTFLFTGLFEEFGFRGYTQYTLGSGIGFWPAAIILSILFGATHLGNPGEAKIGAVMAGTWGLLAVFSLRRTGSLWFAVGMHAAFDWTETYFHGVPDSGLLPQGHLLNSTFRGPDWLTGGSVGPEGSALSFVMLVLAAVGIHFMFPAQSRAS